MKNRYRTFYAVSLAILLSLSAYPIYMGIKTMWHHLQNGHIPADDFPKYIIPYTPLCIAVLITAAILPLLYRLSRRWGLLIASLGGSGIFFAAEFFFEQIRVLEGYKAYPLESWQLALCMATPEVLQAIGEPIYAENNPAFKVHFYLIAILILISVLGVLYGFQRMYKENLSVLRRPLTAQTICVATFIGMCVLACFTAFFRNGTIYISPLSSLLTGGFFILMGVTFGVYIASFLLRCHRRLAVILPVVCGSLMTLLMYVGELMLMDGVLFRFGSGVFFSPIAAAIPFSPCDMAIICAAGCISGIIARFLHQKPTNA